MKPQRRQLFFGDPDTLVNVDSVDGSSVVDTTEDVFEKGPLVTVNRDLNSQDTKFFWNNY